MKIVVAICGRACSGRHTFARRFIDRNFECVKFASRSSVIRTLFPSINTMEHTDGLLKDVEDPH
jgi:hypothetical protein